MTSTSVMEKEEIKTSIAPQWRVIIHNDDRTSFDFVIALLINIFNKELREAVLITASVHTNGRGIAGIYNHEVAEQKQHEGTQLARAHNFPLRLTLEQE